MGILFMSTDLIASYEEKYKCPICKENWTYGYYFLTDFLRFMAFRPVFKCSGCKQVFDTKRFG